MQACLIYTGYSASGYYRCNGLSLQQAPFSKVASLFNHWVHWVCKASC